MSSPLSISIVAPPQLQTNEPATEVIQALAEEFSDLDKTMEEINDSLIGMDTEVTKPSTPGSADELSDDETDSEDDEGV